MYPSREDIARLVAADGPIASLYLRLGIETGTTADRAVELRWRGLREHLASAGADDRTLKALESCVEAAAPGPRVLVVFAGDGQVRLSAELDDCPAPDGAWFGPVPAVAPLLRWLQTRIPYVVALVDRTGAQLTAYDGGAQPVDSTAVVGPDDEIERNAPGGTAQARYQHRAEDSWDHNAAEVARQLTRVSRELQARLLVAAGDVRAVQLLREHLPEHEAALLRTVSANGDYSREGTPAISSATLAAARDDAVRAGRADLLRHCSDVLGAGVGSVQGVPDTLLALRAGAAATLLVVDEPADRRTLLAGGAALDIATHRQELTVPGEARPARLVDALVRAALATRADVVVLDPGELPLRDGVGALLRT